MSYIDQHEDKWDQLHSVKQSRLIYPTESVIRFIRSSFSSNSNANLLDLGCGSGRHMLYAAREGYHVSGLDLSLESVQMTKELLDTYGYSGEVVQGSLTDVPFNNDTFDGIVCYGVLLYLKRNDIIKAVQEIHRLLKAGGKAFIVVRSINDLRVNLGKEIEANTYQITSNETNEEGMVMYFFNEEEIRAIFAIFKNIQIGFHNFNTNSLVSYHSDYLITVTK
jgi:cyclopropane fatty-acyl-phospholipid synthase-like methyltransferase